MPSTFESDHLDARLNWTTKNETHLWQFIYGHDIACSQPSAGIVRRLSWDVNMTVDRTARPSITPFTSNVATIETVNGSEFRYSPSDRPCRGEGLLTVTTPGYGYRGRWRGDFAGKCRGGGVRPPAAGQWQSQKRIRLEGECIQMHSQLNLVLHCDRHLSCMGARRAHHAFQQLSGLRILLCERNSYLVVNAIRIPASSKPRIFFHDQIL